MKSFKIYQNGEWFEHKKFLARTEVKKLIRGHLRLIFTYSFSARLIKTSSSDQFVSATKQIYSDEN